MFSQWAKRKDERYLRRVFTGNRLFAGVGYNEPTLMDFVEFETYKPPRYGKGLSERLDKIEANLKRIDKGL